MNFVECEMGHFYDRDVYDDCPKCKTLPLYPKTMALGYVDGTGRFVQNSVDEVPTSAIPPQIRAKFDRMKQYNEMLPLGCLIQVSGHNSGKIYKIAQGNNFIKIQDEKVWTDCMQEGPIFANVFYDINSSCMFIPVVNSTKRILLNDVELSEAEIIDDNDIVVIGSDVFVFRNLCNAGYKNILEYIWDSQEQ